MESLQDLYHEELADLYSAEQQLVKALPKMAAAAHHPSLRSALESHLEETKAQVERLETLIKRADGKPKSKTCQAMKGLIEEGSEMMKNRGEAAVIDAGLIGAAQRVEHYEIAGYGCARTYAELLGDQEAVMLLQETLEEEKSADAKLNSLAKQVINIEAARV
ncbi:MAG: ferritin-like domain-containing protein [Phycisphaerales bacterium]|nr:ferritin-like domain-containing protein [Phycisphaerales bacterium]